MYGERIQGNVIDLNFSCDAFTSHGYNVMKANNEKIMFDEE